jgi:hypothetical protein
MFGTSKIIKKAPEELIYIFLRILEKFKSIVPEELILFFENS